MVDFNRSLGDDGVFMADYILLDHSGTIKAFGKNGFIRGLPFFVLDEGTRINELWS